MHLGHDSGLLCAALCIIEKVVIVRVSNKIRLCPAAVCLGTSNSQFSITSRTNHEAVALFGTVALQRCE